MNRQRKILITVIYNDLGIIVDTKAEELDLSANLQQTCNQLATDTISRQAAIDVLAVGKEILSRVLDDVDVVGIDREKYSWGLGLIEAYINDIKELPHTQSEIIRCEDCKYANVADTEDSQDGYTCQFHRGSIWFSGSYCSWAERREDG